ncbi:hypothetical protein [Caballeronia sp. KNU42]
MTTSADTAAIEPVAWRYLTPTGWHATTDVGKALRVKEHHTVEPLGVISTAPTTGNAPEPLTIDYIANVLASEIVPSIYEQHVAPALEVARTAAPKAHWQAVSKTMAITVWKDGSWKQWPASDARYAEGNPEWFTTVYVDAPPANAPVASVLTDAVHRAIERFRAEVESAKSAVHIPVTDARRVLWAIDEGKFNRYAKHGEYLFSEASKQGWMDDGEGPFEFIARISYARGLSDSTAIDMSDEQISAIIDEFDACHWIDGECRIEGRDMMKLCRALLAASMGGDRT